MHSYESQFFVTPLPLPPPLSQYLLAFLSPTIPFSSRELRDSLRAALVKIDEWGYKRWWDERKRGWQKEKRVRGVLLRKEGSSRVVMCEIAATLVKEEAVRKIEVGPRERNKSQHWVIATKYAIGHISIVDIVGIVVGRRWSA